MALHLAALSEHTQMQSGFEIDEHVNRNEVNMSRGSMSRIPMNPF